jgi:hypothetical protein
MPLRNTALAENRSGTGSGRDFQSLFYFAKFRTTSYNSIQLGVDIQNYKLRYKL